MALNIHPASEHNIFCKQRATGTRRVPTLGRSRQGT